MAATKKIEVPYNHNSADLATIYLGLAEKSRPAPSAWKPVFRDTKKGRKVIFARFPVQGRSVTVWIRDSDGERAVRTEVV